MFLYLTIDGLTINKSGGRFVIYNPHQDSRRETPISLIEWIVLIGNIQLTTQVIKACLKGKIPVFFLSKKWNYFGKLDSIEVKNVELLYKQIQASMDEKVSLSYAKSIVYRKIENSRIMLMRWSRTYNVDTAHISKKLYEYSEKVKDVINVAILRWIEWIAAKTYYSAYSKFIQKPFQFNGRNRRPPRDEVNSMLSLGYTLLAQTIQMMLDIYNINTQIWFYHKPKDLRTLLVLDMMEMFRARVVDDMVIRVINKEAIIPEHFILLEDEEARPVYFTDEWLPKFLNEYYKTVFKKKDDFNIRNKFLRLKTIEKEIEIFKQSLSSGEFQYEGFKIK